MAERKKKNSGVVRVERTPEKQQEQLTELFRELLFLTEKTKLYCEAYGYDYEQTYILNNTPEQLKSDTENVAKLNRIKVALGKTVESTAFKLKLPSKNDPK